MSKPVIPTPTKKTKKTIWIVALVLGIIALSYYVYQTVILGKKVSDILNNPAMQKEIQRTAAIKGISQTQAATDVARGVLKAQGKLLF